MNTWIWIPIKISFLKCGCVTCPWKSSLGCAPIRSYNTPQICYFGNIAQTRSSDLRMGLWKLVMLFALCSNGSWGRGWGWWWWWCRLSRIRQQGKLHRVVLYTLTWLEYHFHNLIDVHPCLIFITLYEKEVKILNMGFSPPCGYAHWPIFMVSITIAQIAVRNWHAYLPCLWVVWSYA